MDAGDLTERLKIKENLKCKNFTWYLQNVRPGLLVYDHYVFAWGTVCIFIIFSYNLASCYTNTSVRILGILLLHNIVSCYPHAL